MHCHTAWGQWAVELMSCTASLPGGSGQCNSCNALPHCPGAVGSSQRPGPTSLGGRGVLPKRRSVPMERLQGTAVPNRPGPPAWGTRSVLKEGLRGMAVPNSPGSPAGGDGVSCLGGGRCSWRAHGG